RVVEPAGADLRGTAIRDRASRFGAPNRRGQQPRRCLDGGGVPVLKVLVTGATGFLGRHVVAALLRRGCQVRGFIRPATRIDGLAWADQVDIFQGDLRLSAPLTAAFDGIDVLVHLAAWVGGSDGAQMADTVGGTERLLEAMASSATRRLVLASSF